MASIRPRVEGSIPACGGDATSFTLTVRAPGAGRSFASCVDMGRAGPFLALDDLFALSQQLDGYLAACTPDGGVRPKSGATCIHPIGPDAGAADAAVDAPAVTPSLRRMLLRAFKSRRPTRKAKRSSRSRRDRSSLTSFFGTGGADALFGVPVGGSTTQTLAGPIGIGGQNT